MTSTLDIVLHRNIAQELVSRVAKALHVDGVVDAAFKVYRLLVSVDGGAATEFPLFGEHSVECAPGDHDVDVAIRDFMGNASITERVSSVTFRVRISDGQRTVVHMHWPPFVSTLAVDKIESCPVETATDC